MKKFILSLLLAFTVLPLFAQPVITNQPANSVVIYGGNATFNVMVTGVGPFTYQWLLNGTNLPNNIITTVAGGALFDGLPATNTILNSPQCAAVDASGNLFISDMNNNVIRKVDTNGLTKIVAGTGSAGFSGDGGAATNASLWNPTAVVVDPKGNLFIADTYNYRIRKMDTNGIITTVAGTGSSGYNGDGAAISHWLNQPSGLCLDAAGNLFIADTFNSMIRKLDNSGILTRVAGSILGSGFSGDGGSATSTTARLYYPTGVAIDSSNNMYIADSLNNRIRKVNSSGIISTAVGNGTVGYSGDGGAAGSATLNAPVGVAVDATRNFYIVDSGNHSIRKVGTNGIITTIAGNGIIGFSGDSVIATNARLANPQNISVDNSGTLFIADAGNNRIRRVDTNGIITTKAGRNLNDGDSATNGTLNSVSGVAFDPDGALFLADTGNNRIRKVDTNGIITTVAGNGFPGYAGDGAAATNASLNQPFGLALDVNGQLYIADTMNNRIRKVDTNGVITTLAGNGVYGTTGNGGAATNAKVSRPRSLATDAAGNVFIADTENVNNPIRKVDTNGNISAVVTYTGAFPFGICRDTAGNLFFQDQNAIRKMSTNRTQINFAGAEMSSGFSGDGGLATSARLNLPRGVVADPSGNIFIADTFNSRIRKINKDGIITTIAGNGTMGYYGHGIPSDAANLDLPSGEAVDKQGCVYFADAGNNRIRKLSYVEFADQPTFTVTNATIASVSNHYSVVITSASGSVTSSVAVIHLQLPPVSPVISSNAITFAWSAVSNFTYQLQSATNLITPDWQNLGVPITATNSVVSTPDIPNPDPQRFYRVQLVQ